MDAAVDTIINGAGGQGTFSRPVDSQDQSLGPLARSIIEAHGDDAGRPPSPGSPSRITAPQDAGSRYPTTVAEGEVGLPASDFDAKDVTENR
jgi:hypothetical protein